nr:MAG TPA: hypothetical protein [Caudoviricetes sp.]
MSTNTRQINRFGWVFTAIKKRRNDHFKPFLRSYIHYNVFINPTYFRHSLFPL